MSLVLNNVLLTVTLAAATKVEESKRDTSTKAETKKCER